MTLSVLVLAAFLAAAADTPPATVIVGATMVDGGARAPAPDSIVVMREGVIAAVGDRMRTPIPKGALLIDGRRMWIAPVPAAAAPGPALLPAIGAIVRGPAARIVPGQPAHLALLDGDPRREAPPPALRQLWVGGRILVAPAGASR